MVELGAQKKLRLGTGSGFNDMQEGYPKIKCDTLINELTRKLFEENQRFVVISSPPATGKTTLLEMFIHDKSLQGIPKSVMDTTSWFTGATGFDVEISEISADSPYNYSDTSKRFVNIIDDAQHRFQQPLSGGHVDDAFWAILIKTHTTANPLPDNISFIICCTTYQLAFPNSSLSLAALPRLRSEGFRVEPDVACAFLDEIAVFWSDKEHIAVCQDILSDARVQNVIITECNGSVGALKYSCDSIGERMKAWMPTPTFDLVNDVLQYYLSNEMLLAYARCFGGLAVRKLKLTDPTQAALREVLRGNIVLETEIEENTLTTGILTVDPVNQSMDFASPWPTSTSTVRCIRVAQRSPSRPVSTNWRCAPSPTCRRAPCSTPSTQSWQCGSLRSSYSSTT